MRIFSGVSAGAVVAVVAGFLAAPLWQSEETRATQIVGSADKIERAPFASATDAYREGSRALDAKALDVGEREAAIAKLRYAAERGVLGAQLRLARLYRTSEPAEAFRYFTLIADQHADILPSSPIAGHVMEAFVALGDSYRSGIPGELGRDAERAAGFYFHAASFFGSSDAQYELALMNFSGEGLPRNPELGLKWLANAAKKRHAPSLAMLGDILWRGDIVPSEPVTGLALMIAAKESAQADDEEAVWIGYVRDRAMSSAEANVREKAEARASSWRTHAIGFGLAGMDVSGRAALAVSANSGVNPAF
jgi:TPR repeat protein